jgi:hypothetical protein
LTRDQLLRLRAVTVDIGRVMAELNSQGWTVTFNPGKGGTVVCGIYDAWGALGARSYTSHDDPRQSHTADDPPEGSASPAEALVLACAKLRDRLQTGYRAYLELAPLLGWEL